MKILFAAGDFDKQLHATNKIVYNIAQNLAYKGNECIFAGISIFDSACIETQDKMKLVRINSSHPCDKAFLALENFIQKSGLSRDEAKKKFYLRHPFYTAILMYRYNIGKKPLYNVKSYVNQMHELIKKENPDVMVVSYMPFAHAYALLAEHKWDIPVIAYQLDPWGLHCTNTDTAVLTRRIAEETALFDRCTKIVTTPVLYRQYAQHPDYQKHLDKMFALNFPNIKPLPQFSTDDCVFDFDNDIVNLLFCGIIHDEYRNPQYLLDNLKSVRDSGFDKFKIHFLGTNESSSLKQFMSKNDWVVHHSNVPLDKAFATMAQADILVNIGNTFNNQVPSKIFDYFAFGKPILNVEKIADCPAREYFNRYPLTFTVEEWNPVQHNNDIFTDFLQKSKKQHIDYSRIEELYDDCTLNYATNLFYDIINKIKTQ